MSDIEGEVTRVGASECGQRASFNGAGERALPSVLATAARGRELYVFMLLLQINRNCGELLKCSFQIFYDLKLVRRPRSLDELW